MHPEVLVHPQRVERGGIKPREEHVDDDEKVNLAVLHPERHILVVVLELVGRGVVVGAKHRVVVLDSLLQKVAVHGQHAVGILVVLVLHAGAVVSVVDTIAEDSRHLQPTVLPLELVIIEFGILDACHGKDRVEARHAHQLLHFLHLSLLLG